MASSSQVQMPETAAVVIVGAGISGLVAGRELVKAGIEDIVVVEARDEAGGRARSFSRDNGKQLEIGGELTGPLQPTMLALGAEFGVDVEPMPMLTNPEEIGTFVRIDRDGTRHVEPFPLADDPEALEAYGAAAGKFDALINEINPNEPWVGERALELDRRTIGDWLDENVTHPIAREELEFQFAAAGPPYEASLLATLAFFGRHGGMAGFATALPSRFKGGTAQITARIARELGDRVVLSTPVRTIVRNADGVSVITDRGSTKAGAVIVAIEPNLAAAIEFQPPLPADRVQLQTKWIANPAAKVFAIYETPFWREDGFAGFVRGGSFFDLAVDFSPADSSEGYMVGMVFLDDTNAARKTDALADIDHARAATIDDLSVAFGPKAQDLKELHVFDWHGDRWSGSVGGAHLQTGALSGFGHALRPPVGRIVWAGEANGTGDYMEGAASAGRAAAAVAAKLAAE